MADPKRAPASSGKGATPKTVGPAMQDSLEALTTALGARIKLTTVAPHSQNLEGTLFTACPQLNVVAINTAPAPPNPTSTLSNQPGDYHVIPFKHISSFQILSLAANENAQGAGWAGAQPPIARIDTKKLREREEAKVKKLKEEERKRGKGVSKEGQAIYNALDRMYVCSRLPWRAVTGVSGSGLRQRASANRAIRYPTRWHEQNIVVNDAVIISPPYNVEDCKAPKDKATSLVMIKRVLEGERRKLATRAAGTGTGSGTGTGTPPVGPRKGG
ncbi:hypothetical protein MBLNU459_g2712t1 [Dothideomycetes sp. NU459]